MHGQHRKTGLRGGILLQQSLWLKQKGLHMCPVVGVTCMDLLPDFFKPFGEPFKYENHDPFPCQVFVAPNGVADLFLEAKL